ncbi:hypothetical protein GOP47_0014102 [Adiantum capillus-veneris]|uniref:Uncharacterized protein n=1 Tax=Adiantum capillus-veneris TaxID=13818 RepID=A0A9D4UQH3_ADICA|nr:hypothetical protein GOP47_0014102 [Adiantum capillus-veneris]
MSLYMMAITTGSLSPNLLILGVDQVDSKDNEMYFQLVVVAILVSQLLAATVVTYIDNAGMWVWGLGLCVVTSLSSLMLFAGSLRWIRYRQVSGNPFLRNTQVLVAALRKHRLAVPKDSALLHEYKEDVSAIPGCRKLHHTCTLSFLDKAAVLEVADTSSCWRLCTVTQVEELKSFLRVIPAGISLAFVSLSVIQICTLFEEQAVLMDPAQFSLVLSLLPEAGQGSRVGASDV